MGMQTCSGLMSPCIFRHCLSQEEGQGNPRKDKGQSVQMAGLSLGLDSTIRTITGEKVAGEGTALGNSVCGEYLVQY